MYRRAPYDARYTCTVSSPGAQTLLHLAAIGRRLGLSRERARQIADSDPTFPEPAHRIGRMRLWNATDIETWITEHRPEHADTRPAQEGPTP